MVETPTDWNIPGPEAERAGQGVSRAVAWGVVAGRGLSLLVQNPVPPALWHSGTLTPPRTPNQQGLPPVS
jgi:hypothetical protein